MELQAGRFLRLLPDQTTLDVAWLIEILDRNGADYVVVDGAGIQTSLCRGEHYALGYGV